MELFLATFIFLISLVGLVQGSRYFLMGAERIGFAIGLAPLAIGIFIIGFATSLPELASVISAVFQNHLSLPTTIIIGSNIVNILIILGVAALLFTRIDIEYHTLRRSLLFLVFIVGVFLIIVLDGTIVFFEGVILSLLFVLYLLYKIKEIQQRAKNLKKVSVPPKKVIDMITSFVMFVVGGVFIFLGAKFLISSAIEISQILQVAEEFIGLTAIAIGTSTPELAVAIHAFKEKKSAIAIGGIIGSSIFNLTLVLGVGAILSPLSLDTATLATAMPMMIFAMSLLVFFAILKRIYMWEGVIFLSLYLLFILKLIGII